MFQILKLFSGHLSFSEVEMSEEQYNNVVKVNRDFWWNYDYMRILNSGVPLQVGDSCDHYISVRGCARPEI